jgi:PAS domain S-box-containing protein
MIGSVIDNSFAFALSFINPNTMALVLVDGDERVKFCTPGFLRMLAVNDLLPQDLVGQQLERAAFGQLKWFHQFTCEVGASDGGLLAQEVVVPGNRIAEWISYSLGAEGRLWLLRDAKSTVRDELSQLAFFENMTDGFWTLNSEWQILQVSRSFTQNFGKPQAELLGQSYWDLRPDLFQSDVGRLIRRSMKYRKIGTWRGSDTVWGKDCSLVAVPVRGQELSLFLKVLD